MTTKIIITPARPAMVKKEFDCNSSVRTFRVVSMGENPIKKLPVISSTGILRTKSVNSIPFMKSSDSIPFVKSSDGCGRVVLKRSYASLDNERKQYVYSSIESSRKRQRLDHLTNDQKSLRRKLKNRVAAQSARDRKKEQMDELILRVEVLEQQNKDLSEQNEFLKKQNGLISVQNSLLLNRLGKKDERKTSHSRQSLESAALIRDPQQKGQDCRLVMLLTLSLIGWANFQAGVAVAATTASRICSRPSLKSSSEQRQVRSEDRRPQCDPLPVRRLGPELKMWRPPV